MNINIVIIDDDRFNIIRWYVKELRKCGFFVEHYLTADEYFRLSNKKRFSLFIIDIGMPAGETLSEAETHFGKWSGLVLAQKMLEKQPQIPVILLTNYGRDQLPEELSQRIPNVIVAEKQDFPPSDFVKLVRKQLRC